MTNESLPGDNRPGQTDDPDSPSATPLPTPSTQTAADPSDAGHAPNEAADSETLAPQVKSSEPAPEPAPEPADEPADETSPALPESFDGFAMPDALRRALVTIEWTTPTPVQSLCFDKVTRGRDVLVQSQTGTGKTGAFLLPWVAALYEAKAARDTGVQLLVLTPTRELARQICTVLDQLSADSSIVSLPIYGGTAMQPQLAALKEGVHAVIGTPGRILDHIRRRTLDLSKVRMAVLDEADEMLSMGFLEDIHAILDASPKERQTCLFSATVPPDIERIARRYMRDPEQVLLSGDQVAAAEILHAYYQVSGAVKIRDLLDILHVEEPRTALIFCNTREQTTMVASALRREGCAAEPLSSDLTQTARERVMERMRLGKTRFLCATDVASRGIDISHISHVINYAFPENAESYIHRTGRTGRAGRAGIAVSLIAPQELGNFYYLKLAYPSLTFEERALPSPEALAAQRIETKLDRISKQFGELVSPEWTLLARNLMGDPRGEAVIALLLNRALSALKEDQPESDLEFRRDVERTSEFADGGRGRGRRGRDGDDRGSRRGRDRDDRPADGNRFRSRDRSAEGGRDGDRDRDRGRRRSGTEGSDAAPSPDAERRPARTRDRESRRGREDDSSSADAPKTTAPTQARAVSDAGAQDFAEIATAPSTAAPSPEEPTAPEAHRAENIPADADVRHTQGDNVAEAEPRPRQRSRRRGRDTAGAGDTDSADQTRANITAPDAGTQGVGARAPDADSGEGAEGTGRKRRRGRGRGPDSADAASESSSTDGAGARLTPAPATAEAFNTDRQDSSARVVQVSDAASPPTDEGGIGGPRGPNDPREDGAAEATATHTGEAGLANDTTVAAFTDSQTDGDALAPIASRRRRRRRRGRRGAEPEAGATTPTTAPAAPRKEPKANDDANQSADGAEDGARRGRRGRRRRRRRDGGEDGNHANDATAPEAVDSRVSQDEIVIDIDEEELKVVRDEFGEIDELDDLTLKGRRRGVMDDLREEVEIVDLSARDSRSEDTEADDDDDDDDDAASGPAGASDETAALATDETANDEAAAKKKRRRRRRRKKKEEAPAPDLTAPPHKDFWEVWAANFSYNEFEDEIFLPKHDIVVEADEPPPPPPPRERPRRSRATTAPAPAPAVQDGPEESVWLGVRLNLGRKHGMKAASIRTLLSEQLGLGGRAVRNLTVSESSTRFRIGENAYTQAEAALPNVQVEGTTLEFTVLDRDPADATTPTTDTATPTTDAATPTADTAASGGVAEILEPPAAEAAADPLPPPPRSRTRRTAKVDAAPPSSDTGTDPEPPQASTDTPGHDSTATPEPAVPAADAPVNNGEPADPSARPSGPAT